MNAAVPAWVGSSPLARGLPYRQGPANNPVGIIPARAGFTTLCSSFSSSRTDHPRSRGVYASASAIRSLRKGSSPLARGLPHEVDAPHGAERIIPARAGFTPRARTWATCTEDHPRSRGVYAAISVICAIAGGSSPLARGLRRGPAADERVVGIIPARAGFTPCGGADVSRTSDHPRSRGVYNHHLYPKGRPMGSSPLARGLPGGARVVVQPLGIIPARAGFTPGWSRWWPSRRDHPRSRGVYPVSCKGRATHAGSSPLARGLRRLLLQVPVQPGIIPARAGFTPCSPVGPASGRDHPRSRGVYLSERKPLSCTPGSSPLARGLRRRLRVLRSRSRIIPARAGFTRPVRLRGRAGRDHPRSRGVY